MPTSARWLASSPAVAGALGYEEVFVMGRSTADGASHVASLAAHPEAAAACRQMSAGDFVGRVGYDWVLG